MASFRKKDMSGTGAVALMIAWMMATFLASAQTGTPGPIVLDRRMASNLILSQMRPEYPPLAKLNYIQGKVRMEVVVTREGRVGEAHVVSGHPFLAVPALKAVRRWLYRPFISSSGPIEFMTVVEVNFALRTRKIEQLPLRAEQDLDRQIRPPEILEKTPRQAPSASIRVRVLVSEEGQAIDVMPARSFRSRLDAATRSVERWTFRPAHWGTLPVPWYLDVDVPVEDLSVPEGAGDPGTE